jgi:hypothetical protein
MTHEQSAAWVLGGRKADQVEEAIAAVVQALECPEDVLVEVDNGSVAFVLEHGRCV